MSGIGEFSGKGSVNYYVELFLGEAMILRTGYWPKKTPSRPTKDSQARTIFPHATVILLCVMCM